MREPENLLRAVRIISQWEGIDFLIWFLDLAWIRLNEMDHMHKIIDGILSESRTALKPMAVVVQTDISPKEAQKHYSFLQKCVSSELPVYYSFSRAANVINLILSNNRMGVST